MKNRSPVAVFIFSFLTFGIYSWYWLVKTKGEMNSKGEKIPTAWFWLIPIVGTIYWSWVYSEGVGHVTNGKMDPVLCFVLIMLLGFVGLTIIQHYFNEYTGPQAQAQPQVSQFQPAAAPVVAQPQYGNDQLAAPTVEQPVVPQQPIVTPQPVATPAPVQPSFDTPQPQQVPQQVADGSDMTQNNQTIGS